MTRPGENFYELLGVPADASEDTIHRAYRRLARRVHPDVNAGAAAEAFQDVSRAYEVLRDPEARASYDRALARPIVRSRRPPERAAGPRVPYFSDRVAARDVPRFLDEGAGVRVSVRVSWLPRFLERWL